MEKVQGLESKFEFREIMENEAEQAVIIEKECFPPKEACSRKMMIERINIAPDFFLVAIDRETGKIAGFLNGIATNEETFRDEFFENAELHNPIGVNIMLLGLDVLPEYRMQGLATELVQRYVDISKRRNKKKLVLTCLASRVDMYKKMGFRDIGIANSTWGGAEWHEMDYAL